MAPPAYAANRSASARLSRAATGVGRAGKADSGVGRAVGPLPAPSGVGVVPGRAARGVARHRATRHRATRHRATRHRATRHRAARHRATRHRATRHRVGRHRAARHRAARHRVARCPGDQIRARVATAYARSRRGWGPLVARVDRPAGACPSVASPVRPVWPERQVSEARPRAAPHGDPAAGGFRSTRPRLAAPADHGRHEDRRASRARHRLGPPRAFRPGPSGACWACRNPHRGPLGFLPTGGLARTRRLRGATI